MLLRLHTVLLKKRENERHKVGETPAAGETPAPEKKLSEQVQTVTSTNPTPSSSVPTPSSGETSTASSVTKTEEKTEEVKAASDDKKSEETVVSDDKQSGETVVSETPEGSTEKSADSSIPVSDSEKTVNGAKSHGVPGESSKPEASNVSTEEPEKSDS